MDERLKGGLPIIAVAGALAALLMSLLLGPWVGRRSLLTDTGETRRVLETTTLARLQAVHPSAPGDASLRRAVDQAQDDPYVAVVWLFAPDGQVLKGSRAISRGTAEGSATDEMRRVVGMLPEEMLSAEQRTALLAASAMQAEGEHNDIYRHLLREVRGPNGDLVAWVGLTYDVSPAIGAPGLGYMLFTVSLFLTVGIYWLSLSAWVWLDARARGERAWAWATFVLLGNLVALMAYVLTRAPRPQVAPTD